MAGTAYFCMSCGNGKKFERSVPVRFEIDGYDLPNQTTIDVADRGGSGTRCQLCGSEHITNLLSGGMTPKKLLLTIVAERYSTIGCPVVAMRKAKSWFTSMAPHYNAWMDDEIIDDIILHRGEFDNILPKGSTDYSGVIPELGV